MEAEIQLQDNQCSPAVSLYCQKIGIEFEGWSVNESAEGLPRVRGGVWIDDAGKNLCEAVTDPCETVDQAFAILEKMIALSKQELAFVSHRPFSLMRNSGKWHDKLRYTRIVEALRLESPIHWEYVNRMTESAALQVNFSGAINPFGDDGAFLINMFNDIAPGIAAQVHREIGYGKGHLSLWQKFARAERLPLPGRWFSNGRAMVDYIETVPRLIRESLDGDYVVLPRGEYQSVYNKLDLGVLWWFLRAKRGQDSTYLELRHLPSMSPDLARRYAQQSINMIEVLLDWFHGPNKSQPVLLQRFARGAYKSLSHYFPDYVPEVPVTTREWRSLLRE